MRLEKIRRYILMLTSLLALAGLILAVIPASAQLDPNAPTPAAPLASQAASTIYLPLVSRISFVDLTLEGVEVTQAVQNLNNTVSLVAGRSTMARVYVKTNTDTPVSNVHVSLSATRNGAPLTGSPLTVGPKSVSNTWSRSDLNTSFNFTLPSAWLSGQVSLEVVVDPNNQIFEGDKLNNRRTLAANFVNVPTMNIKAVPIEYTDPRTGLTFPPPSSSFLAPGVLKMYPVSAAAVSDRAAIGWSQDLSRLSGWSNLLSRIATIKSSDNAPASQVYYGLVPLLDPSGNTWFSGGYAGIGYVGLRVSVGLTHAPSLGIDGPEIANHEIGHNLGREHAPCGVSDPDPGYPYPDGSIGQFGLTISPLDLYEPWLYADIMGYCTPTWISDYTYQALLDNQRLYGGAAQVSQAPTPSLLVRASFREDGMLQMEPVYVFDGLPDPPTTDSDYALELIDEQGALVASYPVPLLHAEEKDLRIQGIHAMAPLPEKPFHALRITEKGKTLAVQPLAPLDGRPQANPTLQMGEGGAVLRWGAADTPAILRYTQNDGATWTTLAVDYLGGQFTLDEGTLPPGPLRFEIILANQPGAPLTLEWEHAR